MSSKIKLNSLDKPSFANHLAGIIPIGSVPTAGLGMPWHETLMPVAPHYSAIQRAVVECAILGCNTIWIVSSIKLQPLVREHLGELIRDQKAIGLPLERKIFYKSLRFKRKLVLARLDIPIYYIAYPQAASASAEGAAFAILYGITKIKQISSEFSKLLAPEKYWISFPHGVHDSEFLISLRDIVRRTEVNTFLAYESETIRDGKLLGFSFKNDDLTKFRSVYHRKYQKSHETFDYREQSASRFKHSRRKVKVLLEDVFKELTVEPGRDIVLELPWYSQIDSWEGYCSYLATNAKKLERTNLLFASPRWQRRLIEFDELLKNMDSNRGFTIGKKSSIQGSDGEGD